MSRLRYSQMAHKHLYDRIKKLMQIIKYFTSNTLILNHFLYFTSNLLFYSSIQKHHSIREILILYIAISSLISKQLQAHFIEDQFMRNQILQAIQIIIFL